MHEFKAEKAQDKQKINLIKDLDSYKAHCHKIESLFITEKL